MKMDTPEEIQAVLGATLTTVTTIKDSISKLRPCTADGRQTQADLSESMKEILLRLRQVELYVDEVV